MEITNIAELFSENIFALQNITNSKNNSKRAFDGTIKYDSRNCIIYHIFQQLENEEFPSFHQMRINRITGSTVTLRCIHDPSSNTRERWLKAPCTARLTVELEKCKVVPIFNGSRQIKDWKWAPEMTKEFLKNPQ